MADPFTNDQFAWLRQIAADCKALPSAAAYVAIALTKYFSRKRGGLAWMSQETLAGDLGVSEVTVRRALAALVDRGHLVAKRRGREETNTYRLVLKNSEADGQPNHQSDRSDLIAHEGGVTDQICPSDRSNQVKVTDQIRSPNPLSSNPLKEPIEDSLPKKGGGKSSSGRRRPLTSPPESISDQMREYAHEKAGWNSTRSATEFQNFRDFHLKKGNQFADWLAAWRGWARLGAGYDQEKLGKTKTIDQDGRPVGAPPPHQQQRQRSHRKSNAEIAMEMVEGDDE
jgi:hypothetical protein